jgi:hypothetical protein
MEEISRQASFQSVAWLLLTAFSQVYSENCEQKAEWKYLKSLPFAQKRSNYKVVAKESVAAEQIRAIKKESSILYQDYSKDAEAF